MPNNTFDGNAFCPYYIKQSGNNIFCNGCIASSVTLTFDSMAALREHFDSFCGSRSCAGCVLYDYEPDDYFIENLPLKYKDNLTISDCQNEVKK